MNRTTTVAVCVLLAGTTVFAGCRVERTRGQRTRAREVQGVLNSEAARLAEQPSISREEFERLVTMYDELTLSAIRSAEARPLRVQDAEDGLDRLALDVKDLPAYQERSARAQNDFERTMKKNQMPAWKQWRGRKLARERRKDIMQEQNKQASVDSNDS